jgi:hypothetical protein
MGWNNYGPASQGLSVEILSPRALSVIALWSMRPDLTETVLSIEESLGSGSRTLPSTAVLSLIFARAATASAGDSPIESK